MPEGEVTWICVILFNLSTSTLSACDIGQFYTETPKSFMIVFLLIFLLLLISKIHNKVLRLPLEINGEDIYLFDILLLVILQI